MMLVQSRAVESILGGSDAGWKAQRRDGTIPGREVINRHLWHTGVGVILGLAAWLVSAHLFFWMLPIVIGLVLAMGTSALTAQRRAGRAAFRLGLFRTPEETAPPPVLRAARTA